MRKLLSMAAAMLLSALTAVAAYADDTAQVTISVRNLPQELQNRSVLVTIGSGPSDTDATLITLDGLNNYIQTVTLAPAEYYCTAAVQYDTLGEYPMEEINRATFFQAQPDENIFLVFEPSGGSWYAATTGQERYYTLRPQENPPADYTPQTAQIGAYCTAPVGFSQHVIAYLENLYTGEVVELHIYPANKLTVILTDAESGKYAFLSAHVAGDAANRYQIESEQETLTTEDGADFHLMITDNEHPEQESATVSRDENETVQAAAAFNAAESTRPAPDAPMESLSQPVEEPATGVKPVAILFEIVSILAVGGCLLWFYRRHS